jgi:hypothetical protein
VNTSPNTLSGARVMPFPTRPWWASAANPACVAWCEREHATDAFATEAALLCWRTIVDDDRFVVRADSYLGTHEEGTPTRLGMREPGVFVDVRVNDLDAVGLPS